MEPIKVDEVYFSPSTHNPEKKMWVEALRQALSLATVGNEKEICWIISDKVRVGSFLWICGDACLDLKVTQEIRDIVLDIAEKQGLYLRLRKAKNRHLGYKFTKKKKK